MGLVGRLLTLPLEPVRGVAWLGEQLLAAAENEFYDEAVIRRQLLELSDELEAGRISEEEYEAQEEQLVERLLEAQRLAGGRRNASGEWQATEATSPTDAAQGEVGEAK